jgi:acetyltransferase-like isoleucine patch superfamily enzyme
MEISGRGKVLIGDNFHSGPECRMITSFHNYEGLKIPYDETYLDKDIVIGDNVWLGTRVIILGGVIIEEGAIIQAGSVVVSDIPKGAIAGGHPAKVFKYRDLDHYDELKALKAFH